MEEYGQGRPSEGHDSGCPTGFGGLAEILADLLDVAELQVETDRDAAKAAIARASSLLRVEIDRYAYGGARDPKTGGLAGWQIQRVRAFIDDHLDQTIRIRDLSAIAQRSVTYFCRAFKHTFGLSPHAYLIRRRLDHAGRLMLATDTPLSEIALSCGFTDQAHLSKMFRQSAGQSPAAWRRERRAAAPVGLSPSGRVSRPSYAVDSNGANPPATVF